MMENLISRSPGSLISVFLPLLLEQKNVSDFTLLLLFYHHSNIELLALGLLLGWLPRSRCWDAFETLCFMAVWVP